MADLLFGREDREVGTYVWVALEGQTDGLHQVLLVEVVAFVIDSIDKNDWRVVYLDQDLLDIAYPGQIQFEIWVFGVAILSLREFFIDH